MIDWTKMKRRILIGSLSSPTFTIGTAKIDRSRITFGDLPFQNISQKKHIGKWKSYFSVTLGGQFQFHYSLFHAFS